MLNRSRIQKLSSAVFVLIIALTVLAGALPQPALAASPAASCVETHVVKSGETIWRIARDYEVTVNRLAKTNNLTYPYPLTVGQSLCIPDVTPANANAKWTATFKNGQVSIEGSGFKKQYPFFVRVRENDTSAWYKLGTAQSDKQGELDEAFKAPKDLLKKSALMVCLKDGVTDALSCKKVFRQ
jgi:hypothetical protein